MGKSCHTDVLDAAAVQGAVKGAGRSESRTE